VIIMTDTNAHNESYEDLLQFANRLEIKRDTLAETRDKYISDLEQWRHDITVLDKVGELYKHLLDRYVNQYAESFSSVITEGLQSIFHDQDISFDVVVGQKHGKVWVDFETVHDGTRGQALESFGGGVASIQSLLLRILVILKKNLARYLILDESLAALSEEYVENAAIFLKKICKDLDMNVLLVTHNKTFLDLADTAYEAELDKEGCLVIKQRG